MLLAICYVANFADRHALAVVQELVKAEFDLADWQLGLLGGTAFAVVYSTLGIPIARFAERANRISIIAASLAIWSAMTAVCGLATSATMLALGRVGVGIGEAGGTPPAHSVISNYFSQAKRATALAVYSAGGPLGTMVAALGGGWIAHAYGWRAAFLALAVPGLILAVLMKLTVKEPARAPMKAGEKLPSFRSAAGDLLSKGTYRHVVIASVIGNLAASGIVQFTTSFFMRTHELGLQQATVIFGVAQGVFATVGTIIGGVLASRLQPRWSTAPAWVCAGSTTLACGFFLVAFLAGNLWIAVGAFMIAKLCQYGYPAPSFSMMQSVAHDRSRATAMALYLLATNLLGAGFGPLAIGALSDLSAAVSRGLEGVPAGACSAGGAGAMAAACSAAEARGLQVALVAVSFIYLWATFHFVWSARFLRREAPAG